MLEIFKVAQTEIFEDFKEAQTKLFRNFEGAETKLFRNLKQTEMFRNFKEARTEHQKLKVYNNLLCLITVCNFYFLTIKFMLVKSKIYPLSNVRKFFLKNNYKNCSSKTVFLSITKFCNSSL